MRIRQGFMRLMFVALCAINASSVAFAEKERMLVDGKPFVKWVGGKGQLIEQLVPLFPENLAEQKDLVYVEPFVGGGALLFEVLERYPNIQKAVINDLNSDLITTYRVVKEQPEALIARLYEQQEAYYALADEAAKKAFYLAERDRYNARNLEDVELATLFVFLNRTCFNGLYRVNSKGEFNVPFGKSKRPLICDAATIRADSKLLQKVTLLNGDFEIVKPYVTSTTFVYFDPPYRPLNASSSFTAYSKGGFDDEQQRRLGRFCRDLDALGARWILSNSDPKNVNPEDDFFEELYAGFEINRVQAKRNINSNGKKRGAISELAIRNYGSKQ